MTPVRGVASNGVDSTTQAVSGANNHGGQQRQPVRSRHDRGQPSTFPPSRGPGVADGALAQALRAVLILTRPEIPAERSFVMPAFSGTPEALAAARAGDSARLDSLELTWLNTWGPRPAIERFTDNPKLTIRALDIHRGAGPRGETVIEWGLVRPCGRCGRRVVPDPRCRFCGGEGHVSDDWEIVHTDIDGRLVEIA